MAVISTGTEGFEIVDFQPEFAAAFRRLNLEWLRAYFEVEAIDEQVLSDPEGSILAHGGSIFFARREDQIIGTGALIKERKGVFELSKMAVTHTCQGQGIGLALMNRIIKAFHQNGGHQLFLDSNRRLVAAINLYRRCGFIECARPHGFSPYTRTNIHMEYHPEHHPKYGTD